MKHKPDKVNSMETQEVKQEQSLEQPVQNEEALEAGLKNDVTPIPAVDWEAVAKEKEKQAADLLDRLQRTMAEFDNYRKRTIKEKASIYDDGVKDSIEKLLPVVDNFERAISAVEDKENSLYKGIEMTFRQFSEILKRMGVEPLPGEGEPFDPNFHHAMAHIEDDTLGESIIAEELQKGYKYKDKVLRPSMVKVAN